MSTDRIYGKILETIGHTPIVKLNRVVPEGAADVYVKLEFFNPGGSIKDRCPGQIEKAEKEGKLKPGDTIVEPTSGNTGDRLVSCSQRQGLPLDHRHAGNHERGKKEDHAGLRG